MVDGVGEGSSVTVHSNRSPVQSRERKRVGAEEAGVGLAILFCLHSALEAADPSRTISCTGVGFLFFIALLLTQCPLLTFPFILQAAGSFHATFWLLNIRLQWPA